MVELDAGTLRKAGWRRSRWAVAGIAAAALIAIAGALVLVRAYMLRNAILPGVTVAGIELGGLERAEARARVDAVVGANLKRSVEVRVGGHTFTTAPSELYRLDAAATEQAAFESGRDSILSRLTSVVAPFAVGRGVEPVLFVRPAGQAELVARLNELTRRAVSARVEMDGRSAVVRRARVGTAVDQASFAEGLRRAALVGSGSVTAEVTTVEPAITTAEAKRAAADAESIASAPVRIRLRDERVGKLSRATLASLVRFQPAGGVYRVVMAPDALGRALSPMVASLTREPVDASFRVEGKRASVVRAKPGTTLDVRKAAGRVRSAALTNAGEGSGRLAAVSLTKLEANLTTREARTLGIKRQLATFTTDMGVSSSNRITNVLLMGEYLDGTILKPGETFSFNGTIGPRTAERGFVEGHMILGGLLVPSIGGGVCQVATTIFNAAFETGLPVKERHNHSFYISHYPTGRDATVSWGGPDLVFRNDLEHAILIKASGNAATFTVTFYGTRQGRKVVASTTTPTNYTSPTLQYAVDPSAPPRSVRTEAGGGPGFDVTVHRKVLEDGKVVREDDFFTRYVPQNPTAVYGPGRTPPGAYFTLPPST
jgi:vancomycin resistance protein YoaR